MPEPQPMQPMTVIDGEMQPAPKVEPEQTLEQKLDAMNSAPASPADYTLPPLMVDGEPWEPTPQEAQAVDALKSMAHLVEMPGVHFSHLAETLRPGDLEIPAETVTAQLRADWGNAFDSRMEAIAGLLSAAEAKRPGLLQFLDASKLGNSRALIDVLWATASRRHK